MSISDWSSDVCSSDLDGVVLRVAAHARIAQPVQLVFVGAEAELAWHVRNVIELGEGAELSLVEQHAKRGDAAQLATVVSDIEQIGRAACRERGCQYV